MNQDYLKDYWFENTEVMVFFKDVEGKYVLVSNACARLANLDSRHKMEGKFDVEVYPSKLAQSFITQDKQVKKTGETLVDIDFVSNEMVGDIVIETVKYPTYDENGKLIGVNGIARDITEKYNLKENLKRKDLKIQKVLDAMPFPFWMKSSDNRYIIVNKAYLDFYKVDYDKIKSHNVSNILTVNKFFTEEVLEKMRNHDAYVLASNKPSKLTVEGTIGGEKKTIEMLKIPILFEDESSYNIVGISKVI